MLHFKIINLSGNSSFLGKNKIFKWGSRLTDAKTLQVNKNNAEKSIILKQNLEESIQFFSLQFPTEFLKKEWQQE